MTTWNTLIAIATAQANTVGVTPIVDPGSGASSTTSEIMT